MPETLECRLVDHEGSAPVSEWDVMVWALAHRSVAVTASMLELA